MISPINWLSPAMMHTLGWTLIHFLWQGAAIAALAAAVMGFCRRPSTRYVTGVAALALMLAMPVVTFLFFDGPAFNPPALAVRAAFAGFAPLLRHVLPWLVECWLIGVVLLSLRFAGGFLLLEQRQRGQSRAASARVLALCREVQQRLGLNRSIRYVECGWLNVPAVIGCIRPMVLLPVAALAGLTEGQLRAVIAHELAHVRRWDFLVNLFQILAETLLFYHPAIWWLNRRIGAERELCCDEIAMEAGDRIEYAHALVRMAKMGSASGFAMAATHGILSERIFHILGRPSAKPRIAGLAGSLVFFMASMAAGNALLVLAAPLPQLDARENAKAMRHIASLAPVSGRPRLESLAAGEAHPTAPDHDYVIPRRNRLAFIKIIRPSSVSSVSMPLLIALVDLPTTGSDNPPVAAMPQTDGPPAHVVSVAAEKLEALTMANQYPAPLLKLNASRSVDEWTRGEAMNYCKDYAAQTVTQGANRPITVDDGVKQRLSFFYWHCMRNNNNGLIQAYGDGDGMGKSPAYIAVGAASSNHPVNVSGSWAISVPASAQPNIESMLAIRSEAQSCSFTQSGNTFSGTCTGRDGSGAATGVIDGRQVRWVWKFPSVGREPEYDFVAMMGPDGAMTGQSIMVKDIYSRALEMFTAIPGAAPTQVAFQN